MKNLIFGLFASQLSFVEHIVHLFCKSNFLCACCTNNTLFPPLDTAYKSVLKLEIGVESHDQILPFNVCPPMFQSICPWQFLGWAQSCFDNSRTHKHTAQTEEVSWRFRTVVALARCLLLPSAASVRWQRLEKSLYILQRKHSVSPDYLIVICKESSDQTGGQRNSVFVHFNLES